MKTAVKDYYNVTLLTSFEYEVDTKIEQQRVVDSKPHPLPKYLYKRHRINYSKNNSLNGHCTPYSMYVVRTFVLKYFPCWEVL